jgi:hypothetical protein
MEMMPSARVRTLAGLVGTHRGSGCGAAGAGVDLDVLGIWLPPPRLTSAIRPSSLVIPAGTPTVTPPWLRHIEHTFSV